MSAQNGVRKWFFVLQQADLLKPSDLAKNIERVEEYAHQKSIQSPIIFTTSAEREFNQEDGSGFEEIRRYIRSMVASGESYKIKLRSVSLTTQKIIETLSQDISAIQTQLAADQAAAEKIKARIAAAQRRSRSEIDSLVERLAARYGTISDRIKAEFRESLSVFTVIQKAFVGIFNREASIQVWIKGFQARCQVDLKSSLEEVSTEGAQNFVDSIRQLLEGLTHDLNAVQAHQIHSSNISLKILERRQEVIESIKAKVSQLMTDQGMVRSINSDAEDMAVEIVGGAFIAVAGTVMNVLQFAVAETIMNALGIAFAGIGVILFAVGVAWQRNRIIQKFEQALDREKGRFQGDVSDRLNQKLSIIYEEIERIFVQFYDHVEREEQTILPIIDRYSTIQTNSQQLFSQISTQLS
ncbi:MAG: hypothetical protein HC825_00900 [Oscillatoriales cyanobacterium RM1_1_9]|nr:hypothetical protein [Oscillatoriales cyanobacterium RM1_1_9]